jgi:hypothetical protein
LSRTRRHFPFRVAQLRDARARRETKSRRSAEEAMAKGQIRSNREEEAEKVETEGNGACFDLDSEEGG